MGRDQTADSARAPGGTGGQASKHDASDGRAAAANARAAEQDQRAGSVRVLLLCQ